MPNMRPQIVNYLTLAFVVLCNLPMHAQLSAEDPGSGPPPPPPPPTVPDLPVDSGLWLLLVAGLGYGAYLIFQKKFFKGIRA
jgi:hypothetical protein